MKAKKNKWAFLQRMRGIKEGDYIRLEIKILTKVTGYCDLVLGKPGYSQTISSHSFKIYIRHHQWIDPGSISAVLSYKGKGVGYFAYSKRKENARDGADAKVNILIPAELIRQPGVLEDCLKLNKAYVKQKRFKDCPR